MKTALLRLWARSPIRILSWIVVSLVVLAIFLSAWLSWSGQRRWQRIAETLKAENETLDFKALMPPRIPDPQNFGAIEPLREITLVEAGDESRGVPGARRRALRDLMPDLPSGAFPSGLGPAFAERASLTKLPEGLGESKILNGPAGAANAAKSIRDALESTRPLLKVFAEAARAQPQAEFVPAMRDQSLPVDLFTLQVPHYGCLPAAATGLRLHGLACLEMGDTAAAVSDALAILRFAEAAAKEPLLIGLLVAASVHQQAADLVWAILASQTATAADLVSLQTALGQTDFQHALLQAARGELVAVTSALRREEFNRSVLTAGRFLPEGFFSHNQAAIAEVEWHHFIRPLKMGGLRASLAGQGTMFDEIKNKTGIFHLDYLLARLACPAVSAVIQRTVYVETLRRQALLACLLEEHRVRNGSYPATLAELAAPALSDVIDSQPMRYRITDGARYQLWSIAFDGKDDGGKVNRAAESGVGALSKQAYIGDWAWRYPAAR